jgi:hypothetical protein
MKPEDPFQLLQDRSPPSASALYERVLGEVATHPEKVRSAPRGIRLLLSVLSTLGVLWTLSMQDWLAGRLELILWGGIMSVLTAGFLLDRTLPGARAEAWPRLGVLGRSVLLGALSVAAYLVFNELATHFTNLSMSDMTGGAWLQRTLACELHGAGRGILGLGLLFLIWRNTDPFTPRLSGGLLGAVAGGLGVFGTTLACGSNEGFHLLIGHALVVSLLIGLGWLFGPRWLAP